MAIRIQLLIKCTNGGEIMTNATAIGYMIIAARKLGYSEDQIRALEAEMRSRMDWIAEDFAEKVYNKF